MGRNNSLNDIGYALGKINPEYMLEVYSNEKDEQIYSVFKDNRNVKYMGSVSYTQVQKRMAESDITVIVTTSCSHCLSSIESIAFHHGW